MPTRGGLSFVDPDILEDALVMSKRRAEMEHIQEEILERQKEVRKQKKEIGKLLKRSDELEKGVADAPKVEYERNGGSSSKRKAKRFRADSPSGDESDEVPIRRPITKVRRMDQKSVSRQSPSCTGCLKKGVRCEWDMNSSRRRCIACQGTKYGCDLKRPSSAGSSASEVTF